MFLKVVLLCLCLWRLTGVTGEIVFVMEGESVTLNSRLTEIKDDDVIQWRLRYTLIAEINKRTDSFTVFDDVLDGRFRDRLKLDNQTGSLTITNTTITHSGLYTLETNGRMFALFVCVQISVNEGDSVTINPGLNEIKDDDVIQWRIGYEKTLLAEINKQIDRFTVYDDVLDGRFRDRLKLDYQTGSLTITNTTINHAGEFDLQINRVMIYFSLVVIVQISVNEGDSVTLNTDLTDKNPFYQIKWRFESTLIAEISKWYESTPFYDNDGRLKVDYQTGSLTLTKTTINNAGHYKLQINNGNIRKMKNINFNLVAIVPISVNEGDSFTLNPDLTEIKDDELIRWRFRHHFIAEFNKQKDSFNVYDDVSDGRFRDRLKLDDQTGSLTITNISIKHAGLYGLETNRTMFSLLVYVPISVNEGDSVNLNSNLTEIKNNEQIQSRFRNHFITKIAIETDRFTVYDDVLDGRFKDRLKVDYQTGSLTITNTTIKHAGHYKLQVNNGNIRKMKNIFNLVVIVQILVNEGDSVTLNSDLTEIKDDDQIQWRFGSENTLIAAINKQSNSFTVYDDVLDGRFRNRLKLDNQTGSLTIINTTITHAGDYQLQMFSDGFSTKIFRVSVYDSVHQIQKN